MAQHQGHIPRPYPYLYSSDCPFTRTYKGIQVQVGRGGEIESWTAPTFTHPAKHEHPDLPQILTKMAPLLLVSLKERRPTEENRVPGFSKINGFLISKGVRFKFITDASSGSLMLQTEPMAEKLYYEIVDELTNNESCRDYTFGSVLDCCVKLPGKVGQAILNSAAEKPYCLRPVCKAGITCSSKLLDSEVFLCQTPTIDYAFMKVKDIEGLVISSTNPDFWDLDWDIPLMHRAKTDMAGLADLIRVHVGGRLNSSSEGPQVVFDLASHHIRLLNTHFSSGNPSTVAYIKHIADLVVAFNRPKLRRVRATRLPVHAECIICSERVSDEVRLGCNHVYCEECFDNALKQPNEVFRCHHSHCFHTPTIAELRQCMFNLERDTTLDAFINTNIARFLRQQPVLMECPHLDCGHFHYRYPGQVKSLCEGCTNFVCLRCGKAYHGDKPCAPAKLPEVEGLDMRLCPGKEGTCNAPLSRIDGCNHVECSICGQHICWKKDCKAHGFRTRRDCYNHMTAAHGQWFEGVPLAPRHVPPPPPPRFEQILDPPIFARNETEHFLLVDIYQTANHIRRTTGVPEGPTVLLEDGRQFNLRHPLREDEATLRLIRERLDALLWIAIDRMGEQLAGVRP